MNMAVVSYSGMQIQEIEEIDVHMKTELDTESADLLATDLT